MRALFVSARIKVPLEAIAVAASVILVVNIYHGAIPQKAARVARAPVEEAPLRILSEKKEAAPEEPVKIAKAPAEVSVAAAPVKKEKPIRIALLIKSKPPAPEEEPAFNGAMSKIETCSPPPRAVLREAR